MKSGIEVKGLDKALHFLRVFPKDKVQDGVDFIQKYGTRIQANAMRVAPVGVTGDLKNDVQFQLVSRDEEIEGVLGFNLFYAKYVHGVQVGNKWVGPRRHFVPFDVAPSLERWAKKVLKMDTSRRRGMWVGGEDKARPFLYEAAIAEQNDMIRAFKTLGGVEIK